MIKEKYVDDLQKGTIGKKSSTVKRNIRKMPPSIRMCSRLRKMQQAHTTENKIVIKLVLKPSV